RVDVEVAQVGERLCQRGSICGRVLGGQLPPDAGSLRVGRLCVGEAVRVDVEVAQVGERLRQIGPVRGRVLRRQLTPDAAGLLEGRLRVGEAVRVDVRLPRLFSVCARPGRYAAGFCAASPRWMLAASLKAVSASAKRCVSRYSMPRLSTVSARSGRYMAGFCTARMRCFASRSSSTDSALV